MQQKQGLLIGICGPTCAGKTTVVEKLITQNLLPNAQRLITFTTRKPRHGEADGVDYYFISEEDFEAKSQAGDFYEQSATSGCRYGSSRTLVESLRQSRAYVFAVLDLVGIVALRSTFPGTLIIGINASSSAIRRRFDTRTWSSNKVRDDRLWNACEEHNYLKNCRALGDFLVDKVIENNHGEPSDTTNAPAELAKYILEHEAREQRRSLYADMQRRQNGC